MKKQYCFKVIFKFEHCYYRQRKNTRENTVITKTRKIRSNNNLEIEKFALSTTKTF